METDEAKGQRCEPDEREEGEEAWLDLGAKVDGREGEGERAGRTYRRRWPGLPAI